MYLLKSNFYGCSLNTISHVQDIIERMKKKELPFIRQAEGQDSFSRMKP